MVVVSMMVAVMLVLLLVFLLFLHYHLLLLSERLLKTQVFSETRAANRVGHPHDFLHLHPLRLWWRVNKPVPKGQVPSIARQEERVRVRVCGWLG